MNDQKNFNKNQQIHPTYRLDSPSKSSSQQWFPTSPNSSFNMHANLSFLTAEVLKTDKPYRIMESPNKKQVDLYMTNYRIIIDGKEPKSIPHGYIEWIDQKDKTLLIHLKTGINLEIVSSNHSKEIQKNIRFFIHDLPFCLHSLQSTETSIIYDSCAQIQRMGIDIDNYSIVKNADGSICTTYPHNLVVPKGYSIENLAKIKLSRYNQRVPIMTFYDCKANACIWRSGPKFANIPKDLQNYDKQYLREIFPSLITISLSDIVINDKLGPLTNLKSVFFNLTTKYNRMANTSIPAKSDIFMKALGEWYCEVDKLITLAYQIAKIVIKGNTMLIEQGIDGTRASQLLALIEIILDPFYRSFHGLSILIQKQFVCFGFQFGVREGRKEESSYAFIQFLECLHQLLVTHPKCFQYSPSYLARIAYQVYTSKYKNFLGYCDKDSQKIRFCSKSIWDEKVRQRTHYNYQFNEQMLAKNQLSELRKKPTIKQYSIWVEYFDLICLMKGEVRSSGSPQKESRRLSFYLSERQKSL